MTSRAPIAVAGSVLWLLVGCVMGPSYRPPANPLPATWDAATQTAATAAGAAAPATPSGAVDEAWWKAFQDPILERLEQGVATANLDVRTATARLTESRLQARITAGYLWPSVNANGSYEREKASQQGLLSLFSSGSSGQSAPPGSEASGSFGSGAGGAPGSLATVLSSPLNLWQYGFDASWELDLWGGARRGLEAARATVQSSQEDLRAVLIAQRAELARDYLMLRGVQAQRAIIETTLASERDTASIIGQRVDAGLTPKQDLVNAEAEVANVAARLPGFGQQEAQLINALSLLLGAAPDALRAELAAPATSQSELPAVPLGVPSDLARRRPDIRRAEAKLHAATAQIGVAVAELYPSISLTGSFGLQALQFSNLGSWSARQYAFGPSLTLPLFEGGRLRGTVELRKAEQLEAAIDYQQTVLQAWHEVANSLIAYSTEQERLQRLKSAESQNEEALRIITERYRRGVDPYLDVLTAQRTLLQSQLDAAQSLPTLQTNLIQLYKALGGGWGDSTAAPADSVTKE
jgi:NodT family efflux transporter outer membrane factor (OMF) lipoprotein